MAALPQRLIDQIENMSEKDYQAFKQRIIDAGDKKCGGRPVIKKEEAEALKKDLVHLALETLVRAGIYPILDYDHETHVCIAIGWVKKNQDSDDERPVPRLEFQLSDGLPGERASSHDFDTYAAAKENFPKMVALLRAAQMRRTAAR